MEHNGIARPARATGPWLGRLAWLPVPLIALTGAALYAQHGTTVYESTVALATLNTLFCTSAALLIAYLSARTYRVTGSRAALALGCGALTFGLCQLLAGLAGPEIGAAVTLHNLGVWLAGALFLLSSLVAMRVRRPSPPSLRPVAGLSYLGVVAALGLVYVGRRAGVLPDLYTAGQGFTPLRQAILSLALLEFTCASLGFFILYGRSRTPFLKWCAIGLALIGLGLLIIIAQSAPGTLLNWLGRSAQYLGGVYLLIAAMSVAQGPWRWQVPLERALLETEERYQALVEATPDAILVHDNGRLLYANPSALRLFGARTFDELRAHSAFDLAPPELHPQLRARLQQLAAGMAVPRWEMRVLRLDGQTVPAEVESALVTFHGSRAVQAVFRDISERKRAEAALRESERRWAATLASIGDAVIVADAQGRIAFINPVAEALTGWTLAEATGVPVQQVFSIASEDAQKSVEDPVARVLREGTVVGMGNHTVLVRKDGSRVPIDDSAAPIRDEDGKVTGVVLVFRDIAGRKRVEEELRETRDYLQNLLDYANAPIIVWDPEFRITQFNHAFEHLTGYNAAEVLSRQLDLLFPNDSKEHSLAHIHDAMAGQHWESVEIPILQKSGGVRTVLWNSATLYAADGCAVVATIAQGQDITERVQVEAERERLLVSERAALEEAEAALRLRDEFLSVAAHELKTPITNLRGYPQLLLRRMDKGAISDAAEVRPALETIDREAGKLSSLVSQLLDIARLQEGALPLERQATDLAGLAREVVASMRMGPAHEHTLHLQTPETLPAYADPLRLQQVLVNLIDNAVKFSPEGSAIEVEVASLDPHTVRLSVRDHGPGMPLEERERLFSRYHRAGRRRPAGGLGLGLYISHRIVLAHNGRIEAEFPEDGGTRFVVTLPTQGIGD